MSRINGIGTWFLGVRKTEHKNICTATLWFTFLFLPLVPLARYKIKPIKVGRSEMRHEKLEKTKFEPNEIARTYLFGWVLIPLAFFGPTVLAFHEIQAALGIPSTLETPLQFIAIAWMGIFFWKLKNWDEDRWLK